MEDDTFLFKVELKDQKHQMDESRSTIDKVDLQFIFFQFRIQTKFTCVYFFMYL